MKQIVYTVQAYRFGDKNAHSYIVGVYSKKHAAIKEAEREQSFRGNKYSCEVRELTMDVDTWTNEPKVIKEVEDTL